MKREITERLELFEQQSLIQSEQQLLQEQNLQQKENHDEAFSADYFLHTRNQTKSRNTAAAADITAADRFIPHAANNDRNCRADTCKSDVRQEIIVTCKNSREQRITSTDQSGTKLTSQHDRRISRESYFRSSRNEINVVRSESISIDSPCSITTVAVRQALKSSHHGPASRRLTDTIPLGPAGLPGDFHLYVVQPKRCTGRRSRKTSNLTSVDLVGKSPQIFQATDIDMSSCKEDENVLSLDERKGQREGVEGTMKRSNGVTEITSVDRRDVIDSQCTTASAVTAHDSFIECVGSGPERCDSSREENSRKANNQSRDGNCQHSSRKSCRNGQINRSKDVVIDEANKKYKQKNTVKRHLNCAMDTNNTLDVKSHLRTDRKLSPNKVNNDSKRNKSFSKSPNARKLNSVTDKGINRSKSCASSSQIYKDENSSMISGLNQPLCSSQSSVGTNSLTSISSTSHLNAKSNISNVSRKLSPKPVTNPSFKTDCSSSGIKEDSWCGKSTSGNSVPACARYKVSCSPGSASVGRDRPRANTVTSVISKIKLARSDKPSLCSSGDKTINIATDTKDCIEINKSPKQVRCSSSCERPQWNYSTRSKSSEDRSKTEGRVGRGKSEVKSRGRIGSSSENATKTRGISLPDRGRSSRKRVLVNSSDSDVHGVEGAALGDWSSGTEEKCLVRKNSWETSLRSYRPTKSPSPSGSRRSVSDSDSLTASPICKIRVDNNKRCSKAMPARQAQIFKARNDLYGTKSDTVLQKRKTAGNSATSPLFVSSGHVNRCSKSDNGIISGSRAVGSARKSQNLINKQPIILNENKNILKQSTDSKIEKSINKTNAKSQKKTKNVSDIETDSFHKFTVLSSDSSAKLESRISRISSDTDEAVRESPILRSGLKCDEKEMTESHVKTHYESGFYQTDIDASDIYKAAANETSVSSKQEKSLTDNVILYPAISSPLKHLKPGTAAVCKFDTNTCDIVVSDDSKNSLERNVSCQYSSVSINNKTLDAINCIYIDQSLAASAEELNANCRNNVNMTDLANKIYQHSKENNVLKDVRSIDVTISDLLPTDFRIENIKTRSSTKGQCVMPENTTSIKTFKNSIENKSSYKKQDSISLQENYCKLVNMKGSTEDLDEIISMLESEDLHSCSTSIESQCRRSHQISEYKKFERSDLEISSASSRYHSHRKRLKDTTDPLRRMRSAGSESAGRGRGSMIHGAGGMGDWCSSDSCDTVDSLVSLKSSSTSLPHSVRIRTSLLRSRSTPRPRSADYDKSRSPEISCFRSRALSPDDDDDLGYESFHFNRSGKLNQGFSSSNSWSHSKLLQRLFSSQSSSDKEADFNRYCANNSPQMRNLFPDENEREIKINRYRSLPRTCRSLSNQCSHDLRQMPPLATFMSNEDISSALFPLRHVASEPSANGKPFNSEDLSQSRYQAEENFPQNQHNRFISPEEPNHRLLQNRSKSHIRPNSDIVRGSKTSPMKKRPASDIDGLRVLLTRTVSVGPPSLGSRRQEPPLTGPRLHSRLHRTISQPLPFTARNISRSYQLNRLKTVLSCPLIVNIGDVPSKVNISGSHLLDSGVKSVSCEAEGKKWESRNKHDRYSYASPDDRRSVTAAVALWDHLTFDDSELDFLSGDPLEVLDRSDRHWWWGMSGGRAGWFPSSLVQVKQDNQEKPLGETAPQVQSSCMTKSYSYLNRSRKNVICEIIKAERDYVKHLSDVIQGYLVKSRLRPDMFSAEKLALIFGNIEAIYEFSRSFLTDLESSYEPERPEQSEIGQCFLKHRKGFEIYSEYCNNHPTAIEEFFFLQQNSKYRRFFESAFAFNQQAFSGGLLIDAHSTCRLQQMMIEISLDGFLLTPVQKICKYPLQLKELLKCTSPRLPDYPLLQVALEAMKGIAVLINERKRKMESLESLQKWQATVANWQGPAIIETSSELIYSGELIKISSRGWHQERVFFLFDHLIVYCKKDLLWRQLLVYRGRIDVDHCRLHVVEDGKDDCHGVWTRNAFRLYDFQKDRWYTMICRTSQDRDKWLNAFATERRRVALDKASNFSLETFRRSLPLICQRKRKKLLHQRSKDRRGMFT